MVTAFLASALLLAAEGPSSAAFDAENNSQANPNKARLIAHIERDMSAALRREAGAQPADRAAAIQRLCELHAEMVSDSRYSTSDALKSYRAKVWSRLTRIKQQLQREIARESGKPAPDQASEEPLRMLAASLASTLSLADQAAGGPGGLLARGGAAQIESNAQSLIELIERTIDPDFWDVNGGPGTIVYYPNLQCLVIRATGEVHGKIGGVLGGARDAGR